MSSPPCAPEPDIAREICNFVIDSGYTESAMKEHGLTDVPWRGSQVQTSLEYKFQDRPALAMLVRLFHFGEAVESRVVSSVLPRPIVEKMLACGMLGREENAFTPECMLTHFGALLLACDSVRRLKTGELADHVVGVNTPGLWVARSLVIQENSEAFDLCTGCGILALLLSATSRSVIATDINPRALAFTQFNAALNAITNVTVSCGDRFDPVENKTFDLIASNPPFFLNPKPRMLFTENPSELDSFVESLVRAAPKFLNDRGFFHVVCEWVEYEDEPWQNRLTGWFGPSGCDVLVLKAYEANPLDYTLRRVTETAAVHEEESGDAVRERVEYFKQKHVKKVLGGLVIMRRRAAKNWIIFEEMDDAPTESVGGYLAEHFASLDVLFSQGGGKLLLTKPRVSKGVRLVQEAVQEGSEWKSTRLYFERPGTLSRRLGVDLLIAGIVSQFDGEQTLDAIVSQVVAQTQSPKADVVDTVLRLLVRLASQGLIEFPNE
jgi:methylase of polypeptide subunit release factors